MKRHRGRAFAAVMVVAGVLAAGSPAGAATGNQSLRAVVVTSGVSGERVVVNSAVRVTGVFSGVGRLVEMPNLPGDPDNALRDDAVFAAGTLHLLSFVQSASVS